MLACGRPREGRDHVVQRRAAKQGAAVGVPDLVLAILAARQDRVVHERPIQLHDEAVVRLPLRLLLARLDGLQVDLRLAAEQDVLAVRRPAHRIDRARHLRQRRPQHAAPRPDLDRAVLARGGDGGAVVTPLQRDDGAFMGLDPSLLAPHLVHEPKGAIRAAQRERVVAPGHPRHGRAVRVEVARQLAHWDALDAPLPHGLVVAA
mmetsp:Transcript_85088/g.259975  ORF Transcript_85088/g.259975 Transcript_85088/m.259975 type:complete len:205 (+) Transcript_85088:1610-2224(+)